MKRTKLLPTILALVLTTAACNSQGVDNSSGDQGAAGEINLTGGERKNGLFDVSIEYDDNGVGWMAYSRVDIPKFIETQIARSDDHGASWHYVTSIGGSTEEVREIDGKQVDGVWRDETACLLFDPTDRADRRWKLFTNRYFTTKPYKPVDRLMGEGTIDIKYAATPAGPWSRAKCVVGNQKGCKVNMRTANPAVADVRMNTEPGAVIANGVIYLSMDASTVDNGLGDWGNYRIIMLASVDHGISWRYVGTLLNHADAMQFGYLVFTGSSLVRVGNKFYLMASPSGSLSKSNRGHDGSMVFEFTDIAKGQIRRDKDGKPVVIKRIEVPGGLTGGLADYDEQNTAGGVVFSTQRLLDFPQIFRLKQTGEPLP